MKLKSIKTSLLFLLVATIIFQVDATAQKKKYKNAPDETIILMIGQKNPSFDESQFPHLRFYYLNDLKREVSKGDVVTGVSVIGGIKKNEVINYSGEPHFFSLWGEKLPLVGKDFCRGIVLDKAGTVAYQGSFRFLFENYNSDTELLDRIGNKPSDKALKEYLADQITDEKTVKLDAKKNYTPGNEPDWKSWKDGDVVGMGLPADFTVHTPAGEPLNFKELINGKPALIFFYQVAQSLDYSASEKLKSEEEVSKMDKKTALKNFISATKSSGSDVFLWELERVLYNYIQPRK